jgi:hypothetical protein
MANLLQQIPKFQPFSLWFTSIMYQYPLILCKIFLRLINLRLFFNMLNDFELLQLARIIWMQQLNLIPCINKKVLFHVGFAIILIKYFELEFLVIYNWIPNFHEQHIIVFVNYSWFTSVVFYISDGHDCFSGIDHHKVDFASFVFEAQMLNLLRFLVKTSVQLCREI